MYGAPCKPTLVHVVPPSVDLYTPFPGVNDHPDRSPVPTYTVFGSDGAVVTSDSTLRFRERDEVEATLTSLGYAVAEVRDAPDRPGREFVFFARRLA